MPTEINKPPAAQRFYDLERPPHRKSSKGVLGVLSRKNYVSTVDEVLSADLDASRAMDDLEALKDQLHAPFDNSQVLESLFILAAKLEPNMKDYDLVVVDDISARVPTQVIWRLINKAREDAGLPKAAIRFVNGKHVGSISNYSQSYRAGGAIPEQTSITSRALILSELVGEGSHVQNLYDSLSMYVPSERIDIATMSGTEKPKVETAAGSYYFYGVTKAKEIIDSVYMKSREVAGVDTYPTVWDGILLGPSPYSKVNKVDKQRREVRKKARRDARLVADTIYALLNNNSYGNFEVLRTNNYPTKGTEGHGSVDLAA